MKNKLDFQKEMLEGFIELLEKENRKLRALIKTENLDLKMKKLKELTLEELNDKADKLVRLKDKVLKLEKELLPYRSKEYFQKGEKAFYCKSLCYHCED